MSILFLILSIAQIPFRTETGLIPEWAKTARIAGIIPEDSSEVQQWVEWAVNSGVSVIDIDVDIFMK